MPSRPYEWSVNPAKRSSNKLLDDLSDQEREVYDKALRRLLGLPLPGRIIVDGKPLEGVMEVVWKRYPYTDATRTAIVIYGAGDQLFAMHPGYRIKELLGNITGLPFRVRDLEVYGIETRISATGHSYVTVELDTYKPVEYLAD